MRSTSTGGGHRGIPIAVLACALALSGCSDEPELRDADGVVVNPGVVSVFELQVGDCLAPDPELVGEHPDIPVVPCAEPHTQEVFGLVEHPASTYPGAAAVAEWADGACLATLDADFGLTLDDGLFISYLLPTFLGWNTNDDREVVCVLVFPDQGTVTGSVTAGTAGGA